VSGVERSNDPAVGRALKEHIERFNMETTGISAWHPITYTVRDLPHGAELRISTKDPAVVTAIHEFLAFQRHEHHAGGMTH